MPEMWRYRGQAIDREQIGFLREFIAAHPDSSRWRLSRQLCEAMGWKQANGALRDIVCRGLLLMLNAPARLPCHRCDAGFVGSAGARAGGRQPSCWTRRRWPCRSDS